MITKFQERVYEAVGSIPRGKVTTYKLLAKHLGCGSSQAIGQALKSNPFAPRVPCHRVIRSDLTLGGYMGKNSGAQLKKKIALLAREGVNFKEGKLANHAAVYSFRR